MKNKLKTAGGALLIGGALLGGIEHSPVNGQVFIPECAPWLQAVEIGQEGDPGYRIECIIVPEYCEDIDVPPNGMPNIMPEGTVADGQDNDCDGTIDEGIGSIHSDVPKLEPTREMLPFPGYPTE